MTNNSTKLPRSGFGRRDWGRVFSMSGLIRSKRFAGSGARINQTLIESEIEAVLSRPRYDRGQGGSRETMALQCRGHRHGTDRASVSGVGGPLEGWRSHAAGKARQVRGQDHGMEEQWRELPSAPTKQAESFAIAGAYLAGTTLVGFAGLAGCLGRESAKIGERVGRK